MLVSAGDDRWDVPGGGKEPGRDHRGELRPRSREEACARVVDSHFLCGLRFVELGPDGAARRTDEHHAQIWARVELEPWDPQFEIADGRVVSPEDAIDLVRSSNVDALVLERAAARSTRCSGWDAAAMTRATARPAKRSSSGTGAPVVSCSRMNDSEPKALANASSGNRTKNDPSSWLACAASAARFCAA